MVRVVKEKEHAAKRNEILDVARRLVYTKGYEQMSIQDILHDLQISKGAFYHYFDSKQALLEALIERIGLEAEEIISPIVHDLHLSALEKFQRYFDAIARWKVAQKEFLLALLNVWYTDHNAIIRQKVVAAGVKRLTPMLTVIICQGVEEGVLTTPFPDQIGEVVFTLMVGLGDTVAGLLLSHESNRDTLQRMESTVAVYTDALERVLGAPTGSLQLIDAEMLKEWLVATDGNGTGKEKK